MRLDIYVASHFSFSRNRAQRIIDEWLVLVDGKVCEKASFEVESQMISVLEGPGTKWVSRSAEKLDDFLEWLWLTSEELWITGKDCLDIGSSTWGFTQIFLTRWAQKVVSIDIGTEQLHPILREHPRLELYEKTDIRKFTYGERFDCISIDVSFISLREIIPILSRFTKVNTNIFLLFKPQFEVGRNNLRKTWVPKDDAIVTKVFHEFQEFLVDNEFEIMKIAKSTVIGEAGNQEYMVWIKNKIEEI